MVRQAHLMGVVGVFLIGCAFLVVGCSGDTGSQSAGTHDSEESESTATGSEHGGAQASEESDSTHEVAEHGGAIEKIPTPSGYGFERGFLLRVGGITYDSYDFTYDEEVAGGRRLRDGDLGPLFAEASPETIKESTNPTTTNSATPNVVPVYAVEGYDTSFRLAARMDDGLMMFESVSDPNATHASDVLDIGGKVSRIDVTYRGTPALVYGTIEDPEKVQRLVGGFMDAPLKPTMVDHYNEAPPWTTYLIIFRLKDGTTVARDYRTGSGRLSNLAGSLRDLPYGTRLDPASGIVTPQTFRGAVEESLQAWRGYVGHFYSSPTEEGTQPKKRTCGDGRTTKEARRISGGGMFYTTNDVFPSGPWEGVLRGTEEDDLLLAGEYGEDEVYGLDGDDTMEGGACDDKLYGGLGVDPMVGEEGDDVLYGGPGNDNAGMVGDLGSDVLYGGDGDDVLVADEDGQQDELYCGEGQDIAEVGEKIDYVDSSCEVKSHPTEAIE